MSTDTAPVRVHNPTRERKGDLLPMPAPPPGFRMAQNPSPTPPPGFRPLQGDQPSGDISLTDRLAGVGRSFLQGVTFGYGDEIIGAARSAVTGQPIEDAIQTERRELERYRRARPTTAAATEIASAFVPFVGPLGRFYRGAKTLRGKVGRGAVMATVAAGAYRSGQAEGGAENRLAAATDVSALDPLLGAAFPVAARALSPVAGGVKQLGSEVVGRLFPSRSTLAEDRVIAALRDAGLTPAQARAQYEAGQRATQMGANSIASLPESIADIAGKPGRRLGFTIAATSGRGGKIAEQVLNARQQAQYERINDALRRALGVSTQRYGNVQRNLLDEQRRLSQQLYQAAYDAPSRINVADVLFERQFNEHDASGRLKRVLERAGKLFIEPFSDRITPQQAKITGPNTELFWLSTRRFDAAKRELDDMIGAAKKAGRNNEARLLTELKNDLLAVADKANPKYAEARSVYSSRAELLDALKEGRKFMRGDSEVTAETFKAMSQGEKRAFRLGVARELQKLLGQQRRGADMTQIFQKPNVQEVLAEIMPQGRKIRPAANFNTLIEREARMSLTRNKVLGGSDTAERLEALSTPENLSAFGRYIRNSGGLANAAIQALHDATMQILKVREVDARKIARMIFATNPATVRAVFDRLEQRYGKQQVRQLRRFLDRYIPSQINAAVYVAQRGASPEGTTPAP